MKKSVETEPIVKIPSDTEIHVWREVVNQFIEITYTVNNIEYQGYITKEDLENNSQKISNEIEMEHLIFIQNTVETLAKLNIPVYMSKLSGQKETAKQVIGL